MSNNGEATKKKLLVLAGKHPEGLTIEDLSKMMGAHRQTVSKYLLWLEGAGFIYMRRIGAVTLCYLKRDWERLRR
jgi:DNA-binding transcriptional ArsR family regulator